MSLAVRHRDELGVAVVSFEGAVDLATLPIFGDALNRALSNANTRVAVELQRISTIDAAAVGELLEVAAKARELAKELVLVCPQGSVRAQLQRLGVTQLVSVIDSL